MVSSRLKTAGAAVTEQEAVKLDDLSPTFCF